MVALGSVPSTNLEHKNHTVSVDTLRPAGTHIDSEKEVSEDMQSVVLKLIKLDVPRSKIEIYLKEEFGITSINSTTFKSIIENARTKLGYQEDGTEVARLVDWLQSDDNKLSYYQIGHDADLRCNKLFYMNQSMLGDFRRNGQVLVMDCTCKTNRFGWALFLCVGINQHLNSVILSIALQKSEDILSFDWVLDCMKSAVGDDAWNDIHMVMTDGDAALLNTLSSRIPHAKHHRCRWHLLENIRVNCQRELGDNYKIFTNKYNACVHAATVFGFNSNWQELVDFLHRGDEPLPPLTSPRYPNTFRYMTDNIYPKREHWAAAWTNTCCSLNAHSTQRVEGENGVIKSFDVNDKASLLTVFKRVVTVTATQKQKAYERDIKHIKDEWTDNKLNKTALAMFSTELTASSGYNANGLIEQGNYSVVTYRQNQQGEARLVRVTETHMSCSCHYPTMILLPCRHVIAANFRRFGHSFELGQVHTRWIRRTPSLVTLTALPPKLSDAVSHSPSSTDTLQSAVNITTTTTTTTTTIEYMSASQVHRALQDKWSDVLKLTMADISLLARRLMESLENHESFAYQKHQAAASIVPLSSTSSTLTRILEPLMVKLKRGRASAAASSINVQNKTKKRKVRLGTTKSSVTTISAPQIHI